MLSGSVPKLRASMRVTITARTGEDEISNLIVPQGAPGYEVGEPYRKMGWHASDTHGLSFSGCRVPADNLLGERGRGFAQFLEILDEGRVAIAALAVGVIRCCLEQSVAYAGERRAFSAIALNAETSSITAIGNDYGFDEVFARVSEVVEDGLRRLR